MAFQSSKIVVWERSKKKKEKWCPYSPDVCRFLEENRKKNILTVCLGDVDQELKLYSINFKDLFQVSEATGTKLPVRRRLCDNLCVLGRGFSWQWLDDNGLWITYDADVNEFIDCSFLKGEKSVNLSKNFSGYPYDIVFDKMIQINKRSKRKRKVQRKGNVSPYPVDTDSNDAVVTEETSASPPKKVLSPEFLAQEIPGTSNLLSQVNAYKRNVESPECADPACVKTKEDIKNGECSKHSKYSDGEEKTNKVSHLQQSTSVPPTTVALVDGKPWTDHRPPHTPKSKIKPVPGIEPLSVKPVKPKRTKRKGKGAVKTCPEEVVDIFEKYIEVFNLSPDCKDTCIICRECLSDDSSYGEDKTVSKLSLCSHVFHKACLEAMYNSGNKDFLQCPACNKIYGEKCGIQPPGEMIYHVLPYSLPGYPENDTIRIIYDFQPGIQGPEHPNPGRRYATTGFPRHCYLPDNEMGRKILGLLVKAWKRRLIFTVGRSATTGQENTITWNEIHHKTEFGCNSRGHGYPDPNYFSNVLAELEAHGITDDEVRVWSPV